MPFRKRILFISHEASLTGAPILLLNIMALVYARGDYEIRTLCVRNGVLVEDFSKFGPYAFLKSEDMYREQSRVKKWTNKLGFILRLMKNISLWTSSDIVFNNTIGNGKVLLFYRRFKKLPVYSYIHELENSIRRAEQQGEAQLTFRLSQKILSLSAYNVQVLHQKFGVPLARLAILRSYIPSKHNVLAEVKKFKAAAKKIWCDEYGIDPAKPLVLGMGTVDRRKAVDYFIQTAGMLKDRDVRFFWIGMSKEPDFLQEIKNYATQHHITNFSYLGPKPHDLNNFLPFDVFFLSSREDPYPLVVLEAASMMVPTICFSGSGGIIDFINDETGWIVDDFSTEGAAQVITGLTDQAIQEKGINAWAKADHWHFNEDAIYDSFCEALSLK